MRGYFVKTKDGFIGMIKDVLSNKIYKGDKLIKENVMIYLYNEINGEQLFNIDNVEIIENLYNMQKV